MLVRRTALRLLATVLCVDASSASAQGDAWRQYRLRSMAEHAADSISVARELRDAGVSRWTTPAESPDFRIASWMTPAWFATDSARGVVATVLSFQAPNGGWSKHVNMLGAPRRAGMSFFSENDGWDYISTIDNGATVTQLQFLAKALAARADTTSQAGFLRGVEYLLRAQLPTGGWPQVYPLAGGYHDATTYNDDATVGVLYFLRDVASGAFPSVNAETRAAAAVAFDRGIAGIVADQVVVNGQLTVWGQQHDPITRAPAKARSYELAGLTAGESSGILELLMSIREPSAAVVRSVHAGAGWLRAHSVGAVRYDSIAGTYVPDATAAISWARIYELPGFRPVMANRDGIPRYDFSELTDRRTGYAWFVQRPTSVLKAYDTWARRHPRKEH